MSAAAPQPSAPPLHRVVALPSGHSLHYHEVVDASVAPSGTTVVLIQGSGPGANGWSNFKHNVGPLAAAGHRVLVPDLLGFGWSSKPEGIDYTLELFSSTLIELLDALQVGPAVLVGNSLGGAVAIDIALQQPERVQKLVMMATGGIETREVYFQMPGIQRMVSGFVGQARDKAWLRQILEMLAHDPVHVDDALVDERWNVLVTQPPEVLGRMKVPDLTPRLPELKLPILGFWGQEDLFCPVSGAHKVLAACPQAAFYLYGGVGHWVMIERAAEFNRHLLHFIAD